MGRTATDAELRGLTDDWLREEIYSREAAAMGLDGNDTIIRRRLVQKLRFLTEDLALNEAPTEAELSAFYAANEADYREPARYDFEHRYFSADRRADPAADAAAALKQMLALSQSTATSATDSATPAAGPANAATEQLGDPFLLQRSFQARSVRQIGDLFGQGFADAFAALPLNRWSGPVASAYGQHLIRVTNHLPGYQPPLADVQQRVLADLARNRREAANEAFYDDLRARYRVIRRE